MCTSVVDHETQSNSERIWSKRIWYAQEILIAVLWTEFKRRDIRRETKQEIPDLTRVHPGDWKAVSSPQLQEAPRDPTGHNQLPLTPKGKYLTQVLEKERHSAHRFCSTEYEELESFHKLPGSSKDRLLSMANIHDSLTP